MHIGLKDLLSAPVSPPTWLVENMFARGRIVILAGEPSVGKSVLSYTMALAVAAGVPFLGYPTVQTPVLYFDEENAYPDMAQYIHWCYHGLGAPDLDVVSQHLRIEHFSLTQNWAEHMKSLARAFRPGLIIVDTVTPACQILDENSNGEASKALSRLREVLKAADNDCAMLLLKHQKDHKPGEPLTMRGAKIWRGSTDATYYHTVSQGRPFLNGLRNTVLTPNKSRAWGLKDILQITPTWTDSERNGLILHAEIKGQGSRP